MGGPIKHAHAIRANRTHTYGCWAAMIQRCRNPSDRSAANYIDRGIKVCERWKSFELFLEDMGVKPEGLTLERKNNNLGYSKDNCIWASRKTQARNRRNSRFLTSRGITKTLSTWAEEFGLSPKRIAERIKAGWDVTEAIETKPDPKFNHAR